MTPRRVTPHPQRIRQPPPTARFSPATWLLAAALLLSTGLFSCSVPGAESAKNDAGQAAAQAPTAAGDTGRAVLLDGPFRATGIPVLSPNLLSYAYGRYSFNGLDITVYFTQLAVRNDPAWTQHNCRGRVVRTIPQSGATVLYYDNSPRWSLFFRIPSSLPDDCPFVATFIDRFVYFYDSLYQQQSYGKDGEIPFPGVLNVQ